MTERERLIELIATYDRTYDCELCSDAKKGVSCGNECIADYLLKNGVIVPPCKVGDMVYRFVSYPLRVSQFTWEIVEVKIFADETHFVDDSDNVFVADEIGKTVFLTREAAEKALAERRGKDATQ